MHTVHVARDRADTRLSLIINGREHAIPLGVDHDVDDDELAALEASDRDFRIVGAPRSLTPAATTGGGTEGGTGAAATYNPELLKLLDGSIAALTTSLNGLSAEHLAELRAAEEIGKTRVGALAAIDDALAALSPPAEIPNEDEGA